MDTINCQKTNQVGSSWRGTGHSEAETETAPRSSMDLHEVIIFNTDYASDRSWVKLILV